MTEKDRTINELRRENEKLKTMIKVLKDYIPLDLIEKAFDQAYSACVLSPKTDDLTDFWEQGG